MLHFPSLMTSPPPPQAEKENYRLLGARFESGSMGDHSYIRFGEGEEKLVIFPTLNDAVWPLTSLPACLMCISCFRRLGEQYSVYVIGRKRKLEVGYSTREMAADYAKLFENEIGMAHVMGISLGGMIAQHFAYDYPQFVKKLILVASAYRMGPEGLEIARRGIPWARHGEWQDIYESILDLSYNGGRRIVYELLKPVIVDVLRRKITDPSDLIICAQAAILHNSWPVLHSLQMPVLMIAGTADRFFPETLFREMQEEIPEAKLLTFSHARHGVYEEHLPQCLSAINEWLN